MAVAKGPSWKGCVRSHPCLAMRGASKAGEQLCLSEDLDLIGGQPGTRQHGFQSGLLPFQQALGLQDAFRCLHPQARESTHTATNNASSARIDRWLVSDSLLPNVSAASVTDLILSDHYGVAITVSPSNAPPRGPGLWSMPPAIISHPAFKTLMTAQIQTFLDANPVTTTDPQSDPEAHPQPRPQSDPQPNPCPTPSHTPSYPPSLTLSLRLGHNPSLGPNLLPSPSFALQLLSCNLSRK